MAACFASGDRKERKNPPEMPQHVRNVNVNQRKGQNMPAKRKFDELYGMSKDEAKMQKKALVERKIKRQFQAALDDVDGQEIEALEIKDGAFSKLEKLDVNCLLEAQKILDAAGKTKDAIKALYKELFNEELEPAGAGA